MPAGLVGLLLVACSSGPADPRPALVAALPEGRPVRLDPAAALHDGRAFEACAGFKQRARLPDAAEADWQGLLTAAARDPNCLSPEQGDSLSAWAHDRPGWQDAVGEWDAARGLWVDLARLSPPSRLRVALRGADQAAVLSAAEATLAADPTDPFACAVVIRDRIDSGELSAAIDTCAGVRRGDVARLRAEALYAAGRDLDAAAAYDAAGLTLHAAAVLYLSGAVPDAEITVRFDEDIPPVNLHRAWFALLRGAPVPLGGLDDSPEATLIRALAGVPTAAKALGDDPTPQALVARARATGDTTALDAALAKDPTNDVLLRAALGVRRDHHLDLAPAYAALAAVDPDHVRLQGAAERLEAPWAVVAPWSWAELAASLPLPTPAGRDPIGDAWRAAAALDAESRTRALDALQADHPELRGLARIRAGGTILDAPPGVR